MAATLRAKSRRPGNGHSPAWPDVHDHRRRAARILRPDDDTAAAFAMPITTARVLFANEGLGTNQPIPLQDGVGRLREGVTLDQARAQLQSLWPSVRQAVLPATLKGGERDDFLSLELSVQSAAKGFSDTRDWYAGPLRLLASATAWLMIIVAANLAGLVLSRAMLRQNELAIRAASAHLAAGSSGNG